MGDATPSASLDQSILGGEIKAPTLATAQEKAAALVKDSSALMVDWRSWAT